MAFANEKLRRQDELRHNKTLHSSGRSFNQVRCTVSFVCSPLRELKILVTLLLNFCFAQIFFSFDIVISAAPSSSVTIKTAFS